MDLRRFAQEFNPKKMPYFPQDIFGAAHDSRDVPSDCGVFVLNLLQSGSPEMDVEAVKNSENDLPQTNSVCETTANNGSEHDEDDGRRQ